jgi:hypothetical protein
MPVGGKLTRLFLKDGLILDATHPQIRVMYGDNVIRNDKYSGNLLIYSTKDFVFEALAQNDSMQGTFITTGKIHIKQQMTLAGQLLANNLFIDANFDGSGFIYVKFDPDTLNIDPELNERDGLLENDSTVVIPIKLSDTATIDVYFSYCFELNDKVDSSDFNLVTDFPVCGIDTKTVKIPVGSKTPTDSIKINVKDDGIEETSDSLIIKIKIESGAVLPNGETSGELKIKIVDAEAAKNTSIVLDKTDTIKTYQEEIRIPPGTGLVGNIKYTDDGLAPLVWTVEDPSGLFTVEDGVIKTNHVFDYETEDTVYVIKVKVVDGEFADSANYTIKITDINEPAWVHDTTFVVPENDTTSWIITSKGDEDGDSLKCYSDSRNDYRVDSSCVITLVTPKDFEKDPPDTLTIYVTDSRGSIDSAKIVVKVKDVNETVTITDVDDRPKVDTIKTNNPDHTIDWQVCEGSKCDKSRDPITVKRDTTVKKCNAKGTVCDSVVFLFNDAPPKITLVNAKSTDALIDYITIEEVKDDKVYVNKKDNDLKVIVQDTVRNTKSEFPINVKLDTLKNVASVVKEYNYVLDESMAQYTNIGGGLIEAKEVVNGVTITVLLDAKTHKRIDSTQTVTYTQKVDGKEVTISYQTDDMTGLRVSDYQVSYQVDSATTVTYALNDKKKIVKNEEGNIAYTVEYNYTDDFGNKSSARIEIVFDDIPPKVEV